MADRQAQAIATALRLVLAQCDRSRGPWTVRLVRVLRLQSPPLSRPRLHLQGLTRLQPLEPQINRRSLSRHGTPAQRTSERPV
eukprot:3102471-Rhodomonas_salina.1